MFEHDNVSNSPLDPDIVFSTEVELGIDALLTQFMEEEIEEEIFYSETSSELDANVLGDFEEHFITESVDIFQEVDIGFDIHINNLQYSSQLDSSFHHFYDNMHTYVVESSEAISGTTVNSEKSKNYSQGNNKKTMISTASATVQTLKDASVQQFLGGAPPQFRPSVLPSVLTF